MENEKDQEVELEEQNNEVEDQEEEVVEDEQEEEVDWKAEALKFKAIAERRNKKKEVLTDKASNPDVDDRIANLELAEKKRQFGYENGLSPIETDKIFQLNQNPDESVLKDPFVKAGLKALRSQDRVSDNSPSISAKAQTLQNKDFGKMSKDEKQAEFTKYMKKKGVIE